MAHSAKVAATTVVAFSSMAYAAKPAFWYLPEGTQVVSLTADGHMASGSFVFGYVYTWTADGGIVTVDGAASDSNFAASADGSIFAGAVGEGENQTAAVWKAGKWTELAGTFGPSSTFGISPDGSVAVGLAGKDEQALYGTVAAVWRTDGSDTTVLNCTAAPSNPCRANVASTNGTIIAGWQDLEDGARNAATWKAGVQSLIKDAKGQSVGEVLYANTDATVLAGCEALGNRGNNGWILRPGDEAVTIIDGEHVFSASQDGSLAGGAIDQFQGFYRTGYLWTPEDGSEDLLPALRRRQVPVPDNATQNDLGALTAVSADGAVVAGWGMKDGAPTGWVAVLGEKSGTPVRPPAPGPGSESHKSGIGRTAKWHPAEAIVV